MIRRFPPIFLVLAGSFLATGARAELVHFQHSALKKVEKQRICLTFSHEIVKQDGKSPTNTREAIECRIRLWPEIAGKAEQQTFDESDVFETRWGVFPLGEAQEQCFDFAAKLAKDERVEEAGRVSVRCAPRSKSDRIFAKAEGRPATYDKGLLASVSTFITSLWSN